MAGPIDEDIEVYDQQRQNVAYGYSIPPQYVRSQWGLILRSINWFIFGGFLVAFGASTYLLLRNDDNLVIVGTLGVVLVGYIFSLCLHEFAHAATAVLGGDTSPSTLRYLTFNPLLYINPLFSIILPLFFLLIGGIALPGGAVYLRRDLVRSRSWQSAISFAGPLMNLLLFLGLALVFRLGLVNGHFALAGALALLAFFELFAAIVNLIPIPPLDGFGVVSPWLPRDFVRTASSVGQFGFLVIFLLLWYVQPVASLFFGLVHAVMSIAGIDPTLITVGFLNFLFWER